MKTVLPWFLFLAAAAGAVFFYQGHRAKSAELAQVRAQLHERESLQTQLEQLKQNQVAPEELARLRAGQEELLRLRNQVRQLTTEKSQLSQQAQAAQAQIQQAQAQVQQAQAQAQALTRTQTEAATQAQAQLQAAHTSSCAAQLRLLMDAKLQWATAHETPVNATPAATDLAPYFQNGTLPVCPGRGQYTFGTVGQAPTCSLPGHALPQPAQ